MNNMSGSAGLQQLRHLHPSLRAKLRREGSAPTIEKTPTKLARAQTKLARNPNSDTRIVRGTVFNTFLVGIYMFILFGGL